MGFPQRRQHRLTGYDYSSAGYYFVTICTQKHMKLFWDASVGADIIRPNPPVLSAYGRIVDGVIMDMPNHYENVAVDKYVIMPNHVHMILTLEGNGGRMISAPTKSVPIIVGQMKRAVSKKAGVPIWQKSYHDHIIRNEADYRRIWEYIDTNPAKWQEDCYYKEEE